MSDGKKQKQWMVCTGDMSEIIEAEEATEAMAKLFTMFDDDDHEPPEAGLFISAIEVVGEERWWTTEKAIEKAGRLVARSTSTVARGAEKQLSDNQTSNG